MKRFFSTYVKGLISRKFPPKASESITNVLKNPGTEDVVSY